MRAGGYYTFVHTLDMIIDTHKSQITIDLGL